jgi:hypothetical protein
MKPAGTYSPQLFDSFFRLSDAPAQLQSDRRSLGANAAGTWQQRAPFCIVPAVSHRAVLTPAQACLVSPPACRDQGAFDASSRTAMLVPR